MAEPVPSFMFDEPEPVWAGDERLPDPREERLQEQYDRDRQRAEDAE